MSHPAPSPGSAEPDDRTVRRFTPGVVPARTPPVDPTESLAPAPPADPTEQLAPAEPLDPTRPFEPGASPADPACRFDEAAQLPPTSVDLSATPPGPLPPAYQPPVPVPAAYQPPASAPPAYQPPVSAQPGPLPPAYQPPPPAYPQPPAPYAPPGAYAPPYPQVVMAVAAPTSGWAVASLVLGIIGILGAWCAFGIPCLLAVILGHIGYAETRRGTKSGKGLAVAGLVLGYICLVPAVFVTLWMLGAYGTSFS